MDLGKSRPSPQWKLWCVERTLCAIFLLLKACPFSNKQFPSAVGPLTSFGSKIRAIRAPHEASRLPSLSNPPSAAQPRRGEEFCRHFSFLFSQARVSPTRPVVSQQSVIVRASSAQPLVLPAPGVSKQPDQSPLQHKELRQQQDTAETSESKATEPVQSVTEPTPMEADESSSSKPDKPSPENQSSSQSGTRSTQQPSSAGNPGTRYMPQSEVFQTLVTVSESRAIKKHPTRTYVSFTAARMRKTSTPPLNQWIWLERMRTSPVPLSWKRQLCSQSPQRRSEFRT